MLATNVFQRGASGWRLLAHHSSTAAEAAQEARSHERNDGKSRTLH
jgi:hypothetical protein